jgi:hypothetical protein
MCFDCGWGKPMAAMMPSSEPEELHDEAVAYAQEEADRKLRWTPGPHEMQVLPMPVMKIDWSQPFAAEPTGEIKYILTRCCCGKTERVFKPHLMRAAQAYKCRFAPRPKN